MKKFLEKFWELDELLQKHFIELGAMAIGVLICAVGIGMQSKSLSMFLLISIFSVLILILANFRMQQCYDGKVVSVEGEVIEIYNRKKKKLKGRLGRSYILIKQEENYIKIYHDNLKKIREGSTVKAFIRPKELTQENQNMFVCQEAFFVGVQSFSIEKK